MYAASTDLSVSYEDFSRTFTMLFPFWLCFIFFHDYVLLDSLFNFSNRDTNAWRYGRVVVGMLRYALQTRYASSRIGFMYSSPTVRDKSRAQSSSIAIGSDGWYSLTMRTIHDTLVRLAFLPYAKEYQRTKCRLRQEDRSNTAQLMHKPTISIKEITSPNQT